MTEQLTGREAQLALNEATFREANERVGAVARRLDIEQPIPFICECGRQGCTTVIRVRPDDYERVRSHPTYFLCAPDHDRGLPHCRLVEELDGSVVVEKLDGAAEIARETDPRRAEPG
jgi:hypothetical protein